jgi:hypothetical protein
LEIEKANFPKMVKNGHENQILTNFGVAPVLKNLKAAKYLAAFRIFIEKGLNPLFAASLLPH